MEKLSLTDLIIIKTALERLIENLSKADFGTSVEKKTLSKITDMMYKK